MPKDAKDLWSKWVEELHTQEGSSADVKLGLKVCDAYEKDEKGEITVGELIKELENFDQDMAVDVSSETYNLGGR